MPPANIVDLKDPYACAQRHQRRSRIDAEGAEPKLVGAPSRIDRNNCSSTRLSFAGAGGALVSHREFYLFIVGIILGGCLMLWAAIHLIDVYVFD
jgi:hypothetical protein